MSLVASLVNSLQRPLLLGSLPCLTLSPRVWPGSDDLTSWINMRRLQRYIDRSFWSVRMIYGYKSPISQSNANVRCCRVGLIQMTLKSLISWQVSEGTLFDWGEWGSTSWKTPDTAEASLKKSNSTRDPQLTMHSRDPARLFWCPALQTSTLLAEPSKGQGLSQCLEYILTKEGKAEDPVLPYSELWNKALSTILTGIFN